VPQVYAGGARSDWSDHYDNIPGAPECWQDGYDDGQMIHLIKIDMKNVYLTYQKKYLTSTNHTMKHSYTVVDMPVIQKKLVRGSQIDQR
jgi:hypothetical protein